MDKPYALIIVDDLDIASLDFRQTLDGAGYLTELVLHNQIDLEQISQIRPDIIFTHFSLPEISGVELLADIRKDKHLNSIPVVGLDFMVPCVDGEEYAIIEANERPGLANHEPQPTAERFIDLLFPQTVQQR